MRNERLIKCHINSIMNLYQFDFSMQGKSLSLTKNTACTIINHLILGTISVNMQVIKSNQRNNNQHNKSNRIKSIDI